MKKEREEIKDFYIKESSLFDGEYDVTFNILDINIEKMTITITVTRTGKIYVTEFVLNRDKENNLYFQYGIKYTKIKVNDFETIED